MDAYSFGMLCLWIIFGATNDMPAPPEITLCNEEFISFEMPLNQLNLLQSLKNNDKDQLYKWAVWLVTESCQINDKTKEALARIFGLILVHDPTKRCVDFECLLHLLAPAR